MGVLLQAAYRQDAGRSVPSPSDPDTPNALWWYDRIASSAAAWRRAGFSAVLLPPVLKGSAGNTIAADGYGTFDDYDLGAKLQCGSISTRFGTRELLTRAVAVMRACGLDVYLDIVLHQRDGGRDGVYRYVAGGGPEAGRFPKNPGCFVGDPPRVPRDPIAGPIADDFPFGDEFAPINAQPPGYVMDGLLAAGDWITRALDTQGYRIDDVKGMAVAFVSKWLNSDAMAGKFAVGEYYDGDPQALQCWVERSGMNARASAFDFSLRFALQAMCDQPDSFDMSSLDHAGLTGVAPQLAVTFVENHDTDTNAGTKIVNNKMMAYAYILTSEGYPTVYYRDYATDPGCYGLQPQIDNLIWIHETLASGATVQRWKNARIFAYERLGYPNLLVALNNQAASATITVQTAFGAHVALHDYTGASAGVQTDGNGMVTITVPGNAGGRGYVAYSRAGYGQGFDLRPTAVHQDFAGADDLDIAPVTETEASVARIWCAAGTPIELTLRLDGAGSADYTVALSALAPNGSSLGAQEWSATQTSPARWVVRDNGWHTLRIAGRRLPASRCAFTLSADYTATQGI